MDTEQIITQILLEGLRPPAGSTVRRWVTADEDHAVYAVDADDRCGFYAIVHEDSLEIWNGDNEVRLVPLAPPGTDPLAIAQEALDAR